MEFKIDAVLPATAAELWAIFFDVKRVATLIPGCENVEEVEPLREFSAVMKQKIGPFRMEVPTGIVIESYESERQVVLVAAGSDKFTGTSLDVRMKVDLDEQRGENEVQCRLGVDARMQVAGRLASLGYPIVKKKSEELFAEFERRLQQELAGFDRRPPESVLAAGVDLAADNDAAMAAASAAATSPAPTPRRQPTAAETSADRSDSGIPTPARSRGVDLVFQWPRVGITVAVGIAVAHGAVAFGQSPWWWLAAPLLGAAAGLGRRQD